MDIFTFVVLSLVWLKAYYHYFKMKDISAADSTHATVDREHPEFLDPILKYTELIISLAAIPCMAAMLARSYEDYPTLISIYTAICVLGSLAYDEIFSKKMKDFFERIFDDE